MDLSKVKGGEDEDGHSAIPVYKQGDDVGDYCRRYAEWIDNHPHFGYPPLPLENKK
jgi:hypothetical protein